MLQARLALVIKLFSIFSIPGSLCGTVHVSFVCMGRCNETVAAMLSSLIFYKEKPVHFHILTDKTTKQYIVDIFSTWNMPKDVQCSIYNIDKKMFTKIRRLSNIDRAGVDNFVKLLLPEILPKELEKVIVLDYDLVFLCDVAELWDLFYEMDEDQIMALAENQSDWHLRNSSRPARGAGFHGGVMLLDLRKMSRNASWRQLWQTEGNNTLPTLKAFKQIERDVIDAIYEINPKLIYKMDCVYNVQLSVHSKASTRCYRDVCDVKVLHYPLSARFKGTLNNADYFNAIYSYFQHNH